MKKQKVYKYMGYNGVVTTPIDLPNISRVELYELYPENGYYLTDGEKKVSFVMVPIDEVNNWTEKKLGTIE